jgi:hypothetical protein
VDPEDSFRLEGPGEGERAAFCRLEHVIPWVLRGARWDPGGCGAVDPSAVAVPECARCGGSPAELVLTRHRMGHRVPDAFCSTEHLRAWASAGGRWSTA